MNLIPFFAVAICFVATCGGEDVKNGKTRASSQDADVSKQLAAREKEIEELKKEIITQRVELEQLRHIKIQIQVQANATGDARKLCQSEIEKYLQEHNNSDGQEKEEEGEEEGEEEEEKEGEDSGIQLDHSSGEERPLPTINGKAKGDTQAEPGQDDEFFVQADGFFTQRGGCTACSVQGPGTDGRKGCMAPFPHHVWFEFADRHTPARVSWYRWALSESPTQWKFIGSDGSDGNCNGASTWTELCGDSGSKPKFFETVGCVVPEQARKPFRCLGIRVLDSNCEKGNSACWDNKACMKDLKFWEVL